MNFKYILKGFNIFNFKIVIYNAYNKYIKTKLFFKYRKANMVRTNIIFKIKLIKIKLFYQNTIKIKLFYQNTIFLIIIYKYIFFSIFFFFIFLFIKNKLIFFFVIIVIVFR